MYSCQLQAAFRLVIGPEDLKGLLLQLDFETVAAQLAGLEVHCKDAETHRLRVWRSSFHNPDATEHSPGKARPILSSATIVEPCLA